MTPPELKSGADRIEITYQLLDAGTSLRFRTEDAPLIKVLHDGGEARVSDHGSHG